MKALLLTVLLLLGLSTPAWATTYYISPTGAGAQNGTSEANAWKLWATAFAGSSCGDTLLIMDGTYTPSVNGSPSLTKVCTTGNELTVRALNERVPVILAQVAAAAGFKILNSSYIVLDGLRIQGADRSPAGGTIYQNVEIFQSNHVTFKNGLVYTNDRYHNDSLIAIHNDVGSNEGNNLIEDTELYDFHRHALSTYYSTHNTIRRVYCHSRNRVDIVGGFVSGVQEYGDGCVAIYPGSDTILENVIAENALEIVEINASAASLGRRNQVLGSVILDTDTYPSSRGIILDSRGNTTTFQVQDTTIRDVVVIGGNTNHSIQARGSKNTQIYNSTVIGSGNRSFSAFQQGFTGGGSNSFYCTNCLAINGVSHGFNIDTATQTFALDYPDSFGNGTAFAPVASHANITNEQTIDPVLGSCYLWLPDASPLKGDGLAGADIGATILYRYENGTLTSTPLWDPTTNEFPHGAVIAGVNDVAGASLFDVHERLHVGTANGCTYPASFVAATNPEDPTGYVSSTGTTSTSHLHTVNASMDSLTVGVALYDGGGNVGTVTGVTSCGGEAITQLATQVTSPAYRRVYLFGKINPTAGVCTIAVATTGEVDGMVTISMETDGISAYDDVATATGLSSTPSVTVPTNTSETIIDMLAGKCLGSADVCTTTLTSGANQTLQKDTAYNSASIDIRGATSTQAGDDGGVMSHTMGGNNYWALAAVALLPTVPDPPPTACVLTQVAGQVDSAFLVNGAVVHLGAVNAANVAVDNGTSFAVTLQTDATAAACATAGRKLYASYDGGAYAAVGDTMTNGLSFFGSTADPLVVSGAISTNLSGVLTNVPGTTIHSASVNPMATMTQDDSLVNRWVLKLDPTAVGTHTFEFLEYTDAGVALDALNPATADAKITVTGTAPVISAPATLALVGPSSNTIVELIWAPSTYATFAGYRLYRGTATGVYGASPIATITPASAAARHTPQTRYLDLTHAAGTYYYVVTAFDLDGNESVVSNEVSITMTGFTARGAP